MERRQLEYFLAVVERSGFTSAAHALHVTQPSLSHGIACLEREVGAPLFHRLSRGATLTAAGEALVGPARQVLRDFGTAHAAVQHVAGLTAGHLDIVSLTTLAVHPLALLAGAMQQRHPRVDLRISGPPHNKAIPDMVRAGVHEIGLTDSARNLEGLESLRLRSDEMLLVLAGDGPDLPDPFPLASLAGLPLVAAPVGSSTRELVDRFLAARGRLGAHRGGGQPLGGDRPAGPGRRRGGTAAHEDGRRRQPVRRTCPRDRSATCSARPPGVARGSALARGGRPARPRARA